MSSKILLEKGLQIIMFQNHWWNFRSHHNYTEKFIKIHFITTTVEYNLLKTILNVILITDLWSRKKITYLIHVPIYAGDTQLGSCGSISLATESSRHSFARPCPGAGWEKHRDKNKKQFFSPLAAPVVVSMRNVLGRIVYQRVSSWLATGDGFGSKDQSPVSGCM